MLVDIDQPRAGRADTESAVPTSFVAPQVNMIHVIEAVGRAWKAILISAPLKSKRKLATRTGQSFQPLGGAIERCLWIPIQGYAADDKWDTPAF